MFFVSGAVSEVISNKHARVTASTAVNIKIINAFVSASVVWLQKVNAKHRPNKQSQANSLKKKNRFKSFDQVNNNNKQKVSPR